MQEAIRVFDLKDEEVAALRRNGELMREDGLALKYEKSIAELGGIEGVRYGALPPKYEANLRRHRRKMQRESRKQNRTR